MGSPKVRNAEIPRSIVACLLLCAVAWIQPGCKPKESPDSPREPSAAPNNARSTNSVRSSNSVLQTELDRLGGLPFQPDPTKRPLILSRPASSPREWVIQTLERGYHATGRTNALWDAAVQRTFEAVADYRKVSETNLPALRKALAAVPATCDDPMIQYMRVRYREEPQSSEQIALEFLRLYSAMARSQYHPEFKFSAGWRAAQAIRTADRTLNRVVLTSLTTINLEDLARDTNAPVDHVFGAADSWVEYGKAKGWLEAITSDLLPILEQNHGGTEHWFRFRGRTEIQFAWGDRGSGYADAVSDAGWSGFERHLAQAEAFLTKAWQMNSNVAETARLMMRVELGQGKGRARMELWFNRAMSLNTNSYEAAKAMSYYLEPRWHGSEAEALKFARSCVTSRKWGGHVPLVLVDLHHSLATYYNLSNSPTYWHRPQVWRDVKDSYERFFRLNPDAEDRRHNYALDAFTCGQYPTFLEQTKFFVHGTNHAYFGGPGSFREMLETATTRSKKSP